MTIALVALLTPLCLALVGIWRTGDSRDALHYATTAIVAATASFVLALLAAAGVMLWGPARSPLLGVAGVGLSIYLDALTAVMLVLVSFVGLVVVRYSRNYLAGDPDHLRFTRLLLFTLASVEALIISGNLALTAMALVVTSIALDKLLLFYGGRPAAQRAAACMR